jgi:hypothetical protein
MDTVLVLLDIPAYLFGPVLLTWGWIRWIRHKPRNWTIGPLFSFVGFCLATAAYAWAIVVIVVGFDFEHNSNYIGRVVEFGVILSLSAFAFTTGGVWRKSPIRWQAFSLSLCALCLFFLASIGL